MRKLMRLTLTLVLISLMGTGLTACNSVAGNVIPKTGPKMEQVYDSMQRENKENNANSNIDASPQKINEIRAGLKTQATSYSSYPSKRILRKEFHTVSNPELSMYVYPHFSGRDQSPVPGYETVFNAYEQNYYAIAGQE